MNENDKNIDYENDFQTTKFELHEKNLSIQFISKNLSIDNQINFDYFNTNRNA